MKTYIIGEMEVQSFLRDLGLHCEAGGAGLPVRSEEQRSTLLVENSRLELPWGAGMELAVSLRVVMREKSSHSLTALSPSSHPDNNMEIVVAASLLDEYEGYVTEPLVTDPVELLVLLGVRDVPPLTSSLLLYFTASLDSEHPHHFLWERLTSHLTFREGDEDVHGDPLPRHVALTPFEPDLVGDHVAALLTHQQGQTQTQGQGYSLRLQPVHVLSTARATSDASLLMSLLTISDDLCIDVMPYPPPPPGAPRGPG
jgi:hypothetical protein